MGALTNAVSKLVRWFSAPSAGAVNPHRSEPATGQEQGPERYDSSWYEHWAAPDQPRSRRTRSEIRVEASGFQVVDWAPDLPESLQLRSAEVVRNRLLGLISVSLKSFAMTGYADDALVANTAELLADRPISVTDEEGAFLADFSSTPEACAAVFDRFDHAVTLYWVLGHIAGPLPLAHRPGRDQLLTDLAAGSIDLDSPKLRSEEEIIDTLDLAFRLGLAVQGRRFELQVLPRDFEPEVLQTRMLVLRWLVESDWPEWEASFKRVQAENPGLRAPAPGAEGPVDRDRKKGDRERFHTLARATLSASSNLGSGPDDSAPPSEEQEARRARSEAAVREAGLPVLDWLPPPVGADDLLLVGPGQISARLWAVILITTKACSQLERLGECRNFVTNTLNDREVRASLTVDELTFLCDRHSSDEDCWAVIGAYEEARTLYWALGQSESPLALPKFDSSGDLLKLAWRGELDLSNAQLRSISEILDELDFCFRFELGAVALHFEQKPLPEEVDWGALQRRSATLRWLTSDNDEPWKTAVDRLASPDPEADSSDEEAPYTDEDVRRKERSEWRMVSQGITVPENLPVRLTGFFGLLRSPAQVAERARALVCVASKATALTKGLPPHLVQQRSSREVEQLGARPLFSPLEAAFIDDPEASSIVRSQFRWAYESAQVLLWALQRIEGGMPPMEAKADGPAILLAAASAADRPERGYRPWSEILDEADFAFRCYAAMAKAYGAGEMVPEAIDRDVVIERYRAFDWLLCDEPWTP